MRAGRRRPRTRRTGRATGPPRAAPGHCGEGGGAARPSGAERPRDDHLLDLVGAFADGEDLRVAVEAADGVFLDVAVAAVDLDRLLGGADGQAPGLELGLRSGQGEVAPLVL